MTTYKPLYSMCLLHMTVTKRKSHLRIAHVHIHVSLEVRCTDTTGSVQMDNVTKELRTNNMKLKGLVESVSPSHAEQCCKCCLLPGCSSLLCQCRCAQREISA